MKRKLNSAVLFGIVFIVAGLLGLVFVIRFRNNATKVEATIVNIITTETNDDDTSHTVIVSYNINGTEYINELNSYSSSMRRGKTTTIYVNKDNPNSITSPMADLHFIIIFSLLGAILIYIGIKKPDKI